MGYELTKCQKIRRFFSPQLQCIQQLLGKQFHISPFSVRGSLVCPFVNLQEMLQSQLLMFLRGSPDQVWEQGG